MSLIARQLPLIPPKAPRLPVATQEYDKVMIDEENNILRLYFNTIDNFGQSLNSSIGGAFLQFPYGSFHQDGNTTLTAAMTNVSTTAIQVVSTDGFVSSGVLLIGSELILYTSKTSTTFSGITRGAYSTTNVAHAIGDQVTEALGTTSPTTFVAFPFTSTDASNNISLETVDSTRITFAVSGYYNIQFSAQVLNYSTTDDNVSIWFRVNGVDVPYSAGVQAVPAKHGSFPGTTIMGWNSILPLNSTDYIQLLFSSDSGNTVVATYPAGTAPVHPVSPSVAITATFVSALFP